MNTPASLPASASAPAGLLAALAQLPKLRVYPAPLAAALRRQISESLRLAENQMEVATPVAATPTWRRAIAQVRKDAQLA